ncbi:MAG: IS1182 family transposase [Planctomycetota bacterium]
MKKFKDYQPNQMFLLPPDPRDWLPEGHLAFFVSDVVDQLDLSFITSYYNSNRGQPPFNPAMMTKLIVYAYCIGVPSSRKIEEKTYTDVAFRVLAANRHPDHDTIANFRRTHLEALSNIFAQVLALCREAKLVRLGHVSLDGSKMRANASKHKAMSYGRMGEKIAELEQTVKELMGRAERTDEAEDRRYGKGRKGDELPEELRLRTRRLQTLREAKAALEERARQKARAEGNPDTHPPGRPDTNRRDDESDRPKSRRGRKPKTPPGMPKDKDQINFTDPDSRIMKDGATKSFEQAYNCQAAVDDKAQIIIAADVTQEANDKQQLKPMVEQIRANTGETPRKISADSGYFSKDNIEHLQEQDIDPYIATGRQKHSEPKRPPPRGRIPDNLGVKERMQRKLRTIKGRAAYSKRKGIAEPVFGQIKGARGFRQFLLRGLEAVRCEWRIICAGHNLLKLFRSRWRPQTV